VACVGRECRRPGRGPGGVIPLQPTNNQFRPIYQAEPRLDKCIFQRCAARATLRPFISDTD
jgi:hypothetical protein